MKKSPGFSLIEMAFVLVIITLLLGGLLVPFTTQVEQRRIAETNKAMEEIKEALVGYALVKGRLPCPAKSASDGSEQDPPCASIGFLPWGSLGVGKLDAWGHLYRYAVSPEFADSATPFTFGSNTTLTVQTRNSAGALINLTSSAALPAVIISHGKNGYGGTNDGGSAVAAATSADEITNATGTNNFVSRTITATGAGLAEFDDLVTWLSPNILFNRMVAAGKLPN